MSMEFKMNLLDKVKALTNEQTEIIKKNATIVMRNNLELWGNSKFNLVVNIESLSASVKSNTLANNRDEISTSLFDFTIDGWGVYNEGNNIEPVGSMEEWMSTEMFCFHSLFRNAIDILKEEDSYNS